MVDCLSLWGSAMFGADAVEESLGFVGAVLGRVLPHLGAMAAELPSTVVGGDHGGPPGHESDSSSASSESSSSCESSDSDVKITEPPVGRGAPTDAAFRIGAEERSAWPGHGGGVGRRKRKRHVPPPTAQDRPNRRRVRPLGIPSSHEGGGGGRLARTWEWRLSPRESPPHPSAVYLGPTLRKLRLGRDHRLNDVPFAMRGRAKARSSRPRAVQQNSRAASGSPNSSSFPFSRFSSSARRLLGSLLTHPPPRPPQDPPPPPTLALASGGCEGRAAIVCPVHGGSGAVSALHCT